MEIAKTLLELSFRCRRLKKWDFTPSDHEVIITFTTVPSRIEQIRPTIITLLSQTHRPSIIELNLAKTPLKEGEKPWSIPSWLSDLKAVNIHWLDHDYGPASKLIPTLERHQGENCKIIVVDDDMVYSPHLVAQLLKADEEAEGKSVFCANGHPITKNHQFFDHPTDKRLKPGVQQRRVAIIEGAGGYCLRPEHFDLEALKSLAGAPKNAMRMDDIWFSGHLSRRGIQKYQVPTSQRYSLPQSLVAAITGPREELSNTLLDHFSADWAEDEYSS